MRRKALGLSLIALGLAISPIPPEGVDAVLTLILFPFLGIFSIVLLFLVGMFLVLVGVLLCLGRRTRSGSRRR